MLFSNLIQFPYALSHLKQVLAISRIMVAWQPIGISMGVFDMCHRYGPPYDSTLVLPLAIILQLRLKLKQIPERKEAVWSSTGSFPAEPRETCPDAR